MEEAWYWDGSVIQCTRCYGVSRGTCCGVVVLWCGNCYGIETQGQQLQAELLLRGRMLAGPRNAMTQLRCPTLTQLYVWARGVWKKQPPPAVPTAKGFDIF